MVGWHHRLNRHEFEQAPGYGEGQGSLACCNMWGCKESDMTERLNWTELWIFCLLFDTVVELFHSTNERLMINSMPKLKYWKMVCLFFRAIDKVKWGNSN